MRIYHAIKSHFVEYREAVIYARNTEPTMTGKLFQSRGWVMLQRFQIPLLTSVFQEVATTTREALMTEALGILKDTSPTDPRQCNICDHPYMSEDCHHIEGEVYTMTIKSVEEEIMCLPYRKI